MDSTTRRETKYIAVGVLVLSVLMEAVFVIFRHWDITVLFGNLLGGGTAIFNYLMLNLTIQHALASSKETTAIVATVRVSQLLRLFFQFGIALLGALLPCFHLWATLIPLIFPRLTIAARPLYDPEKRKKHGEEMSSDAPASAAPQATSGEDHAGGPDGDFDNDRIPKV